MNDFQILILLMGGWLCAAAVSVYLVLRRILFVLEEMLERSKGGRL